MWYTFLLKILLGLVYLKSGHLVLDAKFDVHLTVEW